MDGIHDMGGLGIGLYSVQETLRNLGGEITCTSYAGIGSDFVVKIPMSQQPGTLSLVTTASAS